jgi:predicted nucleic acid-binding protein
MKRSEWWQKLSALHTSLAVVTVQVLCKEKNNMTRHFAILEVRVDEMNNRFQNFKVAQWKFEFCFAHKQE